MCRFGKFLNNEISRNDRSLYPRRPLYLTTLTCRLLKMSSSFEWSVRLDDVETEVALTSTDADVAEMRFPYVWLRDSCRCDVCFHPVALARQMLFQDLDLNVRPQCAVVSQIHTLPSSTVLYGLNVFSLLHSSSIVRFDGRGYFNC